MDPFVAEIRMFPFWFAPKGWAYCNGQLLPISQNTALFSLLGTMYGGDGKSTFALPNLQGSSPMHTGNGPGPGLSQYDQGQTGGAASVTLLPGEMPVHPHGLQGNGVSGTKSLPTGNALAKTSGAAPYLPPPTAMGQMAVQSLGMAGNNAPHNNMQPFLTVSFCIAMQGVFPPRP